VTVLYGVVRPALHQIGALTLDGQHALVTALSAMVREAIEPYGGTLDNVSDDRFSVVFGAPQAHEDHARRALLVALTVQRHWPFLTAAHPLPSQQF
jgi:class 3 adenylate cyclase